MPRKLGDTKDLPEDIWLKWREHGPSYADPNSPNFIDVCVGGSTVSSIFNKSPWICSLEVYDKKRGITPAISTNFNVLAKDAGHKYEPYVADTFVKHMTSRGHKVELIEDTGFYQHDTEDFAVVNLDYRAIVDGVPCIVECKTTNPENVKKVMEWKKGIVPFEYFLQVVFYMWVMNIDLTYIVCCWSFYQDDGSSYAVIKIERNKAIEDTVVKGVKMFVDAVKKGIKPSMAEQDTNLLANYYYRLYGIPSKLPTPVILNPSLKTEILALKEKQEEYAKLQEELTKKEEEIKAHSLALYPIMKNVEYGTLDNGDGTYYSIKQSAPCSRTKYLDKELLKQQRPDLYTPFVKDKLDAGFYQEFDDLTERLNKGEISDSEYASEVVELKDFYTSEYFDEDSFKKAHSRGSVIENVVEPFYYKKPVEDSQAYAKFKIQLKNWKKGF